MLRTTSPLLLSLALAFGVFGLPVRLLAQTAPDRPATIEPLDVDTAEPLLEQASRLAEQVPLGPQRASPDLPTDGRVAGRSNIDYRGLLADSFRMLTLQHSFRIATESRTREALKGPFFEDYLHALSIWRGWHDGDTFRVNYLGHPAMGSFSAFLFANNDVVSQSTEYGRPGYGRAKWRQFLFANVYSLQFELGPYSEAAIGNVDQAVIDHVLTPVIGTAWSVVEDVVDVKLIAKLRRNHPKWANALSTFATPTRSLANVAGLKAPWYRPGPPAH